MTQLAPVQHAVRQHQDVPSFTPATGRLGAYIDAARQGTSIVPVPPDVQQAAWELARSSEPLMSPSTRDHMAAWLGRLAPQVRNAPIEPGDIRAIYEGIWEQCQDLPCGVWCVETRRSWGRRPSCGVFWPAAGELCQHLSAFAATLRNDRAGCEKILAIASPSRADEPDHRKDPVEQQAVAELLQAWRGEQAVRKADAAIEAARTRPIAKATPVNDAMLLEAHEASARAGNLISGARAAALRQKMGLTEREHAHASR